MIKTPYRSESASCYKRLKECNTVYQKAVSDLQATANKPSSFQERLDQILQQHNDAIEKSRDLTPTKPWREEDVYLCCAFDLIEGVFGDEAERIQNIAEAREEKLKSIQNLKDALKRIPFSSPKWNQGTAPIIEQKLRDIENKMK